VANEKSPASGTEPPSATEAQKVLSHIAEAQALVDAARHFLKEGPQLGIARE
jgi:hypothetical protein